MLPLLLAFLATPAPARPVLPPGETAWIFSTIGHSEFCNPGHVRLDLRTGRYDLTVRAPRRICDKPGLERPVVIGTLTAEALETLRVAYRRVLADGLESRACREGRRPQGIILISNGGTPVLLVATGRAVGSPPDDLSCWSEAATAFHHALEKAFGARDWP